MRKVFVVFSILILVSLIFTSLSFATQTAFWKPYTAGSHTYGLFPFNRPDFSDYSGDIKGVKIIGNVNYYSKGKFRGCARFTGNGAIEYIPSKIYPGGTVSIEAWIKINKYPTHNAYIVYRPSELATATKGFSLYIDPKGGFKIAIRNALGYKTITSSPEGIIPLNKWVWIAGVIADWPITNKILYLNGKQIVRVPMKGWMDNLLTIRDEEQKPSPIYIGNNSKADRGFTGLIDEVRIQENIYKFWPEENLSWTSPSNKKKIPIGPPYFAKQHQPVLYIPFNGNLKPKINKIENLKIKGQNITFQKGIWGKSVLGDVKISGKNLINYKEGSIAFWFYPVGVNNYSDYNVDILLMGGGTFYILNGGVGGQPLSFWFPTSFSPFVFTTTSPLDIYQGKWYYAVITWKDTNITIYINGKKMGENQQVSMEAIKNKSDQITINPWGGKFFRINDLYLYHKSLTEQEVKNAYYRYISPSKMKKIKLPMASFDFQYMPGFNKIYYKISPNINPKKINKLKFTIEKKDNIIFEKEINKNIIYTKKNKEENNFFIIPDLNTGIYSISLWIQVNNKRFEKSETKSFIRKTFIWENNTLGKTDQVFPPYTPVKAQGKDVSVVLRKYQMNGFGLWNKVISQGKNILSGPIVIKYTTQNGQGKWENITQPKLIKSKPAYVIYSSRAVANPIQIKTTSKVEFDGTMKVKMQMSPGNIPQEIDRLYVDIPIKEKYAKLFTNIVDAARGNYAGRLPLGNGVIWTSADANRWTNISSIETWQNSFVAYIWLGTETRGLAWFGENDKGWITKKHGSKRPLQEIIKIPGQVILRIYLINKKTIIKQNHNLVFGLDVSPTKPMPKNWRKRLPYISWSGSVVPWGGLDCSYKTPYKNHWKIIDKIVEARNKEKVTKEIKQWFAAFAKKYNPPPVFGIDPWLNSVLSFAEQAAEIGPDKPITVYEEEMATCDVRAPWKTYQDEWTPDAALNNRKWPTYNIFRKGIQVSPNAAITYVKSYRDYGVYEANKWLKRGIGLYWDNQFLQDSYNYRTTAAYITKYGAIQPAVIIWNRRKYMRRVWNLLSEYRERMKHPWILQWVLHMTNTMILPLETFGTADLDLEYSNNVPFSPAFLRTESIGKQVGNYPMDLYPIYGAVNPLVKNLPEEEKAKIEWGMRMTHGIKIEVPFMSGGPIWEQTNQKLNKIVFDFGYGKKDIKVDDYWKSNPILQVNNRKVKWIGMINKSKKEVLLVFSSWDPKTVNITVKLNNKNIGFNVDNKTVINVLTGKQVENNTGQLNINLSAPYGVKLIKIE
jgi:hypothetical protein